MGRFDDSDIGFFKRATAHHDHARTGREVLLHNHAHSASLGVGIVQIRTEFPNAPWVEERGPDAKNGIGELFPCHIEIAAELPGQRDRRGVLRDLARFGRATSGRSNSKALRVRNCLLDFLPQHFGKFLGVDHCPHENLAANVFGGILGVQASKNFLDFWNVGLNGALVYVVSDRKTSRNMESVPGHGFQVLCFSAHD